MVKVREDLTGQRFGKLIVLKQVEDKIKPNGVHEAMWSCKCDCGNECNVRGATLRNGSTTSCGCYQNENENLEQNSEEIAENVVFNFDSLFNDNDAAQEMLDNGKSLAILGDSLDVLKSMKEKTVDLIFADAPYNIGKDFGNNSDKWETVQAYIDWCKAWIDESMRVLKDSGTMYFMTATQHMPYLDVYVSEKYNVLCRIVWTYDSSGVQSKKMFGSLYEPILMINKKAKAKYTFNHQDILVEAKTGAKRKLIDYRKNPPQPYNIEKVPGNVWEFSRVRFKMDEYENHPTQKPEALLERIIKASSNKGDVVLDPFSGSFTTSAVAVKLGRIAVGIDLNEEYYEMGLRRTGITTERNGKSLVKEKVRKTKAKSKYVRD